ncbi:MULTISPECIES: hypothetical protein [Clostridium]|jgi:hypothetical protein|uniref:Uncharacterized protein n=1 Tax=Clostridium lapidicellarium TaxID=3240931 RepID=A0ABV4DSP8_9CLOT|nr:hypothetical protein [uncultured Clostridium sp.]NLU08093.1 hypothetical protein [Clostridiales bacterium]
MKIELEAKEIKNIQNLIISRINELREKISNDPDREDEIKEIIRYYKKLVEKIGKQI